MTFATFCDIIYLEKIKTPAPILSDAGYYLQKALKKADKNNDLLEELKMPGLSNRLNQVMFYNWNVS